MGDCLVNRMWRGNIRDGKRRVEAEDVSAAVQRLRQGTNGSRPFSDFKRLTRFSRIVGPPGAAAAALGACEEDHRATEHDKPQVSW